MYTGGNVECSCSEGTVPPVERWYAVQTRARHEKRVASELQVRGVTNYVPVVTEVHRWSDRRQKVDVPLFPTYAFVRTVLSPELRVAILRVMGVLNFVGPQNLAVPIPDTEIESVRKLIANRIQFVSCPFLKVGQRVRVRGGAMDGLEGFFVRQDSKRLIISIGAIQSSLAISIEGYDIELA